MSGAFPKAPQTTAYVQTNPSLKREALSREDREKQLKLRTAQKPGQGGEGQEITLSDHKHSSGAQGIFRGARHQVAYSTRDKKPHVLNPRASLYDRQPAKTGSKESSRQPFDSGRQRAVGRASNYIQGSRNAAAQPSVLNRLSRLDERPIRSNGDVVLQTLGIRPKVQSLYEQNSETKQEQNQFRDQNRQLFVKNPPAHIDLKSVMEKYGKVEKVEQKNRNYLVTFNNHEAASKAKSSAKPLVMIWGHPNKSNRGLLSGGSSAIAMADGSRYRGGTSMFSISKNDYMRANDEDSQGDSDNVFRNTYDTEGRLCDRRQLDRQVSSEYDEQDDDSIYSESDYDEQQSYDGGDRHSLVDQEDEVQLPDKDGGYFWNDASDDDRESCTEEYAMNDCSANFPDSGGISSVAPKGVFADYEKPQSMSDPEDIFLDETNNQDWDEDRDQNEDNPFENLESENDEFDEYYKDQTSIDNQDVPISVSGNKGLDERDNYSGRLSEAQNSDEDHIDMFGLYEEAEEKVPNDQQREYLAYEKSNEIIEDSESGLVFPAEEQDKDFYRPGHIKPAWGSGVNGALSASVKRPGQQGVGAPDHRESASVLSANRYKKSPIFSDVSGHLSCTPPFFKVRSNIPEILLYRFDPIPQNQMGQCTEKCPLSEIKERETTNDLSKYEMNPQTKEAMTSLVVKKYKRSSGNESDLNHTPETLRPAEVLEATLDYLVSYFLNTESFLKSDAYDFLSDRMRSIRQDYLIQNIKNLLILSILERIARFYILCDYEFCSSGTFNAKMNTEQLVDSLVNCNALYRHFRSYSIRCPFEAEIQSYRLLLYTEELLTSNNSLHISQVLTDAPAYIYNSVDVQFAIEVSTAIATKNYYLFFKLLKQARYLHACLMHRMVDRVRINYLKSVCCIDTLSLVELTELLHLNEVEETKQFCESYDIKYSGDQTKLKKSHHTIVDVNRRFYSFKIVDSIRGNRPLSYFVDENVKSTYEQWAKFGLFQPQNLPELPWDSLECIPDIDFDLERPDTEENSRLWKKKLTRNYLQNCSTLGRDGLDGTGLRREESESAGDGRRHEEHQSFPRPLSEVQGTDGLCTGYLALDRRASEVAPARAEGPVAELGEVEGVLSPKGATPERYIYKIMREQALLTEKLTQQSRELEVLRERVSSQSTASQSSGEKEQQYEALQQELESLRRELERQRGQYLEKESVTNLEKKKLLQDLEAQSRVIEQLKRGLVKRDDSDGGFYWSSPFEHERHLSALTQVSNERQQKAEWGREEFWVPFDMVELVSGWLGSRPPRRGNRDCIVRVWWKCLVYVGGDLGAKSPRSVESWIIKKLSGNEPRDDGLPYLPEIVGEGGKGCCDCIYFKKAPMTIQVGPEGSESCLQLRQRVQVDLRVVVENVRSLEKVQTAAFRGVSGIFFYIPAPPVRLFPTEQSVDSLSRQWLVPRLKELQRVLEALPEFSHLPLFVLYLPSEATWPTSEWSLSAKVSLIRQAIEREVPAFSKVSNMRVGPLVNDVSLAQEVDLSPASLTEPLVSQAPFVLKQALQWLFSQAPEDPGVMTCRLSHIVEHRLTSAVLLELEREYHARLFSTSDGAECEAIASPAYTSRWNEEVGRLIEEIVDPKLRDIDWPAPEFCSGRSAEEGAWVLEWNTKPRFLYVNNLLNELFLPGVGADVRVNESSSEELGAYFMAYLRAIVSSENEGTWRAQFDILVERVASLLRRYADFASYLESSARETNLIPIRLPFPWHLAYYEILSYKLSIVPEVLCVGVFPETYVDAESLQECRRSRHARQFFGSDEILRRYLASCLTEESIRIKKMKQEAEADNAALLSYVNWLSSSARSSGVEKAPVKARGESKKRATPDEQRALPEDASRSDNRTPEVIAGKFDSAFQELDQRTESLSSKLEELVSRAGKLGSFKLEKLSNTTDAGAQKAGLMRRDSTTRQSSPYLSNTVNRIRHSLDRARASQGSEDDAFSIARSRRRDRIDLKEQPSLVRQKFKKMH